MSSCQDSARAAGLLRQHTLWRVAFIAFALCALAPSARTAAQDRNPQSAIDSRMRTDLRVDPVSHALQFQISLGQYPGRAGASLPVTLNYSSKLWQIKYANTEKCQDDTGSLFFAEYAKSSASGWTSNLDWFKWPEDLSWEVYDSTTTKPAHQGTTLQKIMRLFVTLPDGSRHELRRDDNFHSPGESAAGIYYSVDGTRLVYDNTNPNQTVLYLPDGSRYLGSTSGSPSETYIDRNGNTLAFDPNTQQWTDTLGRAVGLPLVGDIGDVPSTDPETEYDYTIPGVGNTSLTYHFVWRHLSTAGVLNESETDKTLRTKGDHTTNCQTGTDNTGLFQSNDFGYNGIVKSNLFDPVVLYQIVLPHGAQDQQPLTYTFKYNIYGEITKVIYPTGGYERFAFTQAPDLSSSIDADTGQLTAQANRGVADAFVSPDGTASSEQHWSYPSFSTVAPDGTRTDRSVFRSSGTWVSYGFDDPRAGMAYDERTYSASGQMIRRKLTDYAVDGQVVQYTDGTAYKTRNPRPSKEVDILLDTGGNALAATTTYQYDADLNQTATSHYDYAPLDQQTAQTGAITSMPQGNLLRTEEATYLVNDPSVDANTQAAYRARDLVALPTSTRVKDAGGQVVAQSALAYDEAAYPLLTYGSAVATWSDPGTNARGNLTTASRWLNTSNTYLSAHTQYDQYGSVRKTIDARGSQSLADYSATYSYAYPTRNTSPVPDPTGRHGSASSLVTTTTYDLSTGLVTSTLDANSQTTNFEYNDPLDRPTRKVLAAGTSASSQTVISYDDHNHVINTASDQNTLGDGMLRSAVVYDGLGRMVETRTFEAGNNYIATDQTYDTLGRVGQTSNPFRPWMQESPVWTTNAYDALGRVKTVTTPDGAQVSTAYSGNVVTVTDQAGKVRRSVSDALGRLVRVDEPDASNSLDDASGNPVQPTDYSYDALDDLTQVQQGAQTRSFVYDSLKRLTSATNPEGGTLGYQYDADGNLTQKADARGVQTNYVYDGLNRVEQRTYALAGATPPGYVAAPQADYFYDGLGMPSGLPAPANALGRLTAVASSVSQTVYTQLDPLGRVKAHRQVVDPGTATEQTYALAYSYDLAGHLSSETYPSGKVVTSVYDGAGRLNSVAGQQGASTKTYASAMDYAAHGAVQAMMLGNLLWEHTSFNARLQPTQIGLGVSRADSGRLQLDYSYGTTDNDGNVQTQTITLPGAVLQQSYSYDELNRLKSAQEQNNLQNGAQTWRQAFLYDRYGNRRIDSANTSAGMVGPNPVFDPSTNRISPQAGEPYQYDAAGNLTVDSGGQTYAYDGENKLVTYNGGASSGGASYGYDGDGKRIKKAVGAVTTVFVYDAAGLLVAEYDNSNSLPTGGTSYLTADNLGTPRVITDSNGSVVSRHDYLPFGEEIPGDNSWRNTAHGYGADDGVRQKFTGYERDNETGLDYAQNRFYSSTQARFTSVDPLSIVFEAEDQEELYTYIKNPQIWNRYAYALNNPLRLVDPDGLTPQPIFDYNKLNDDEKRILNNSKVKVGNETLSGEKLFDKLASTKDGQKALAGFLNLTAKLASISFNVGGQTRTALSFVQSVSSIQQDRIYATVDTQLKTLVSSDVRFSKQPGHQGHPDSFKEIGPVRGQLQLSFDKAGGDVDADIDLYNIAIKTKNPFKKAEGIGGHTGEVLTNKITGGKTDPYKVYGILTRQGINVHYTLK
jgi:RHS repeat-associated protein